MSEIEQDPFIGQRFGDGGHLEVIGVSNKIVNKHKYYYVKCHKCAVDPELHGDAIYEIMRGSVRQQKTPCGCSARPFWTQEQYKVLLTRAAKSKNVEILEFPSFINAESKPKFMCAEGHTWQSMKVVSFVRTSASCFKCNNKRHLRSRIRGVDEDIDAFMRTGKFAEGTRFERSEETQRGRSFIWKVWCPKCAEDVYSKAGLCAGVFTSNVTSLLRGDNPCRCNPTRRLTKLQQEHRVKIAASQDCTEFLRWNEKYANCSSKMLVRCVAGHEYETTPHAFVIGGNRCPSCSVGGFNPSAPATLYILKIHGRAGDFTGYGITGELDKRLATHTRNLSASGFYIIDSTFLDFDMGAQARNLENLISGSFRRCGQDVEGFRKEATLFEEYNNVKDFAEKFQWEYYMTKEQHERAREQLGFPIKGRER